MIYSSAPIITSVIWFPYPIILAEKFPTSKMIAFLSSKNLNALNEIAVWNTATFLVCFIVSGKKTVSIGSLPFSTVRSPSLVIKFHSTPLNFCFFLITTVFNSAKPEILRLFLHKFIPLCFSRNFNKHVVGVPPCLDYCFSVPENVQLNPFFFSRIVFKDKVALCIHTGPCPYHSPFRGGLLFNTLQLSHWLVSQQLINGLFQYELNSSFYSLIKLILVDQLVLKVFYRVSE